MLAGLQSTAPTNKPPAEKNRKKNGNLLAVLQKMCSFALTTASGRRWRSAASARKAGATFGKLSSTEFWQIYVTLIICKDVHAIGIAFCTETKEQKKISSGVDFTCYTLQVLPEPQLSNGLSIHATLFNPRDFAEHIPFEATPTLSTMAWHSIESNGSKTAMKHDFGLHLTHALS